EPTGLVAGEDRQEIVGGCAEGAGAERAGEEEGRGLAGLVAGGEGPSVGERIGERGLGERHRTGVAAPDEELEGCEEPVEAREHQRRAERERWSGCRPASRSESARLRSSP